MRASAPLDTISALLYSLNADSSLILIELSRTKLFISDPKLKT